MAHIKTDLNTKGMDYDENTILQGAIKGSKCIRFDNNLARPIYSGCFFFYEDRVNSVYKTLFPSQ